MFDSIIIGAGFAGGTMARELAEMGRKVLLLEQRGHIGGNSYDEVDENGILVHTYGPHIFHTNDERVFEYLSRFTEWRNFRHEVVGNVYGTIIPIPFNLHSLLIVYGEERGSMLRDKLTAAYGFLSRVPILEMKQSEDADIREIADYVYENVFLKYTMKQWGQTPEEIDPSVTARVPVLISYDDGYFQDKYQGMPQQGYTELFHKLLAHDNIELRLNVHAEELITISDRGLMFEGKPFRGEVVYTGPIDELFQCCFGRLPYRSLRFEREYHPVERYQSHGVVNYTVNEDYTRITEFKYLTGQEFPEGTSIVKEYPLAYKGRKDEIPYYAISNNENLELYRKYRKLTDQIPNFYLLGRLAEYKYYNIDAIVSKALTLADTFRLQEEKG